ncbi:TrkH family potassium uptake protein [Algivirga pacifica]|uniref:Potassium transporter TrkG n=1 Tax=Algivirga pacifica TaxID=1162670 RepID=A0ABP9D0L7_9BACT
MKLSRRLQLLKKIYRREFDFQEHKVQQLIQESLFRWISRAELFAGFLAVGLLVYINGFYHSREELILLVGIEKYVIIGLCIILTIRYLITPKTRLFLRENILEATVFAAFLTIQTIRVIKVPKLSQMNPEQFELFHYYYLTIGALITLLVILIFARNRHFWLFFSTNTTFTFISSFLLLIVLGTGLLLLPACTHNAIDFIDAFFTATSAVCVTGLSPFDIESTFTFKGQLVLLCLFQAGGIGIISLTTFFALMIRKGVVFQEEFVIQDMLGVNFACSISEILRHIINITFITEAIGAVALFFSWGDMGISTGDRIFKAIFHSVSAYCNAGFSNFHSGLENPALSSNLFSNISFMIIIIAGGLGYYTYLDLINKKGYLPQVQHRGLGLQSKIILISSFVLIVGGALLLWATEWESWKELPLSQQIQNAFFTSITTRTAGFSIINIGELSAAGVMVTCLWMYIGGAPNSTAGGIKITTMVIILSSFWSMARGSKLLHMKWYTIDFATIRRSYIVLIISVLLVFGSILLITFLEREKAFVDLFFEVFSALGTAGLSRGITGELSTGSKLLICILMFSGKIGMFTTATLLGKEKKTYEYKYPETSIMVG